MFNHQRNLLLYMTALLKWYTAPLYTAGIQLLSMTLIVMLIKQPFKILYSAYDNTDAIIENNFLSKTLVLDISLLSFTLIGQFSTDHNKTKC